jgi:hypothetical protein
MSLSTTDARISHEDESEYESEYDSDSDSEYESESESESESEEEYESESEEEVPVPIKISGPPPTLQKKLAACDSPLSYKIFAMELQRVSRFEFLKIFIEDPDFQRDLTKVAEIIVADRAYDSGTRLTMMELIHTYNLDKF